MDVSTVTSSNDNDSDYGSDIAVEPEQLETIFSQAATSSTSVALTHLEITDIEDLEYVDSFKISRRKLQRSLENGEGEKDLYPHLCAQQEQYRKEYRHDTQAGPKYRVKQYTEIASDDTPQPSGSNGTPKQPLEPSLSTAGFNKVHCIDAPLYEPVRDEDLRSPLLRFRTKPRKPLSVTDLVSTAWCEMQYWYTLSKLGRTRKTPAMRQGTRIHESLESEVHVKVAVTVVSKEDRFALRMWNVIQGLQTLSQNGLTRELEVWGQVDGQLVLGCIDVLSYECLDKALEASIGTTNEPELKDQRKITDFISHPKGPASDASSASVGIKKTHKVVYITDVKTRGSKSLPAATAFRPTTIQLMLYRRLLMNIASDKLDPQIIFDRFNLDPNKPFSDSFLAQFGRLDTPDSQSNNQDPSLSPISPAQTSLQSSSRVDDSLEQILAHNTLATLWQRMIHEFQSTFSLDPERTISTILTAEYREPVEGTIIGQKTLLYDEQKLDEYTASTLQFWQGQRGPQGVSMREAFKCSSCDFADECTWRSGMTSAAVQKNRAHAGKSVV